MFHQRQNFSAVHRQAKHAARLATDSRQREFERLCGSIIVIAEAGRPVTSAELISSYGFKESFLLTKGPEAAAFVAKTRPALAEAAGHIGRN